MNRKRLFGVIAFILIGVFMSAACGPVAPEAPAAQAEHNDEAEHDDEAEHHEDEVSAQKVKTILDTIDDQFQPCETALQVYDKLLSSGIRKSTN